jgi:hypothetical protein
MDAGARDRLLAQHFYNPRTGFGSAPALLKAAKGEDVNLKLHHVKAFLAKQELRQRAKPLKVNSFVPLLPRQEFQVDLMDMGERAVPRYGLCAIDIFTKKGACIPINSKLAPQTAEALKKVFNDLGYPSSIMLDEGGEFQGAFAHEASKEDVHLIKSRTGGRFVERWIRTLKKALFERKTALGGSWRQYVEPVLEKYNDTQHSSTHTKPNFIASHEYDDDYVTQVHQFLLSHAKFPVHHPALAVGDHVKIRIKPPSAGYKETFNSWSPEVYTVERLEDKPEGKVYHLTGYRRPLLRFELKKVEDVQRVVGGEIRSVLNQVTVRPPAAAPPPVVAAPPPVVAAPLAAAAGPLPAAAPPPAAPLAAAAPAPRPRRPVVIPPRPQTRSVTRAAQG